MSTRQLRRALAQKGITPLPACPTCQQQIAVLSFASHTTRCELDCASEAIQAIDTRLLAIRNTLPRNPEHAELLDVEIAWLTEERTLRYNELFGFDQQGRGSMHTGHPNDFDPF